MRIVLFFLLVLMTGPVAKAQSDDAVLGTDSTGTKYWLIAGSVKHQGNFVYAWLKSDSSKDTTVAHRSSKFRLKFDCINERMGQTAIVKYAPNGSVTYSHHNDYPKMSIVVPETVGAYWLRYVCTNFPSK